MKIALILATSEKISPFVNIFRNILDEYKIKYDIISWDREGLNDKDGIIFKYYAPVTKNGIAKIYDYFKFKVFVINILKEKKYTKLVIFNATIGLYLYKYLKQYYFKKFWFDYRDIALDKYVKKQFEKFLNISKYVSISSYGYKKVLPEGIEYIMSHNFDVKEVEKSIVDISYKYKLDNHKILSTIGGIRDFESNIEVVESLKKSNNIELVFAGKGPASEKISSYVKKNTIKNIKCYGFYEKSEENKLYNECDMVNIYFPNNMHNSLILSNRFYKALIFKKPMVVNKYSIQGELVEKYNLGIAINDCIKLEDNIEKYFSTIDYVAFCNNCNKLLNNYLEDYNVFKKYFIKFIN